MTPETIAAVATPFGEGAIALLRVSGPRAFAVVDRLDHAAKPKPSAFPPRRQRLVTLHDIAGHPLDEVLLSVHRAPSSYTGEDVVEITCHGGILLTRRVLEALLAAGARAAEPGEFTQRAFLNGRMDLTQAEGVMDLIRAQTDLALRAASEQLAGRLGQRIGGLREDLLSLVAHVEAFIDFPEEDIDPETGTALLARIDAIRTALDALLATAGQGRILREGVRTVIYGAPNVGKSSLLNALVGHERAIVSETPGTTRDTIEEFINVRGLPLRVIDTAGLRDTADPLENAGIARTRQTLAHADLTLHVVDGSLPPSSSMPAARRSGGDDPRLQQKRPRHAPGLDRRRHRRRARFLPHGSRHRHVGGHDLPARDRRDRLPGTMPPPPSTSAIKPVSKRARTALEAGRAALAKGVSAEFAALDLRAALEAVGEVVGAVDTEEILGRIFSTFCIGK